MATIDWAGFVVAAFGISLVPGANQLLGLRNAYRRGLGVAMVAVGGGRLSAFAIMIVLVALGLGAVIVGSGHVFTAIKWIGVGYLLFLELQALWSAGRDRGRSGSVDPDEGPRGGAVVLVREEFVVAASNPKAVLLFAALLPQFVSGPGSVAVGLLAVGGGYLAVEATVAVLYVVIGSRLRALRTSRTVDRFLQTLTGACLVAFAGFLAAARTGD